MKTELMEDTPVTKEEVEKMKEEMRRKIKSFASQTDWRMASYHILGHTQIGRANLFALWTIDGLLEAKLQMQLSAPQVKHLAHKVLSLDIAVKK